ncbi:hypothetical protein BSR28_02565 [Boudabousia liubingyangii]|uniref:NAD(P)H-dependent glycerol-3-phosphate dehydrogenase n=1 Tax=Boudabousia liubingyangii TaxID=1921764 RepID=UPI00093B5DAF|nr:NAD(P)H-dependent glycerol-3-phosphate dehydrogenase [Boudabousia liubingyangii]OKL47416.1 hypothetical protein BSR28_02565 [Boudabousia liubingyangii]
METQSARIIVLGAGAWGTTFAQVLADVGNYVTLWARDERTAGAINEFHTSKYLPGVVLPRKVSATTTVEPLLSEADGIVVALPSDALQEALPKFLGLITEDQEVISLTKGLFHGQFTSQIIAEAWDRPRDTITVISGPNLANEIIVRQPAATVVACPQAERAKRVGKWCDAGYFRPYYSVDSLGCEVAGVVKNVIALAVGAAAGMGLGKNTSSTLITRGLAEMTRLGLALGANGETFLGLAGIGDLSTTCTSELSRNYSFGFNIGRGLTVPQALAASKGPCEGVKSCQSVLELANQAGVEMPITESVVDVIKHGHTAAQMGERLLGRARKRDGVSIELV